MTTQFPDYHADPVTCPKCETIADGRLTYFPPRSRCIHAPSDPTKMSRVEVEHFHVTCSECGYLWPMSTASVEALPEEFR